ncbi:hypothetical protein RB594_000303 [Gaeumannomyces avenae]
MIQHFEMPPQRPTRNAQLWQEHKAIILQLAAEHSVKELCKRMKEDHQLDATPAQYDYHLKLWGLRQKNLKRGEWQAAIAEYDRLASHHAQVRILVHGNPLSATQLKRNRRLYQPDASAGVGNSSRPFLPDAISFHVRSADGDWQLLPRGAHGQESGRRASIPRDLDHGTAPRGHPNPLHRSISVVDIGLVEHGTEDLPAEIPGPGPVTADVEALWSSVDQRLIGMDDAELTLPPHPPSPQRWEVSDMFLLSPQASPQILAGSMALSPRRRLGTPPWLTTPTLFGRISVDQASYDSPMFDFLPSGPSSFQSAMELLAQKLSGLFSTVERRFQTNTVTPPRWQNPLGDTVIADGVSQLELSGPWSFRDTSPPVQEVGGEDLAEPLRSLLPEARLIMMGDEGAEGVAMFRRLIFSAANGLAGLNDVDIAGVVRSLSRPIGGSTLLLRLFRDARDHYSKAIAESLLKAAVEAQHVEAVKQILQTGTVDAEKLVCYGGKMRQKHSLLERAAALQNLSLVEAVLAARKAREKPIWELRNGSDVLIYGTGPIACLVANLPKGTTISPDTEQILLLLLGKGYPVPLRSLRHLVEKMHGSDLVSKVIPKLPPKQHENLISGGIVLALVKELNEEEALKVIRYIFRVCNATHGSLCCSKHGNELHRALIESAKMARPKLTSLLLSRALSLSAALSAAFRGGSMDVVQLVLQKGPDFGAPPEGIEHIPGYRTTPLAEAIYSGDEEFIRICESGGSSDSLDQPHHFRLAIIAAASCGNHKYVCKMLGSKHPKFADDICKALRRAIHGGHDSTSLELLQAWASAGPQFFSCNSDTESRSALFAAVLRRNRRITDKILELGNFRADFNSETQQTVDGKAVVTSLWQELIAWGDRELILKTKQAFPTMSTDEETYHVSPSRVDGDMLTFLVEHGVVRPRGLTKYLKAAISHRDDSLMEVSIDLGANPVDDDILLAATRDYPEALPLLLGKVPKAVLTYLSKSMDIDRYQPAGAQAIDEAIMQGPAGLKALTHLLESGIVHMPTMLGFYHVPDVPGFEDSRDMSNFFGLAIVTAHDHYDDDGDSGGEAGGVEFPIVAYLLKIGCDPDMVVYVDNSDIVPRTALLMAIESEDEDLVELMLNHGATVNKAADLAVRWTPLQKAAELGLPRVVRMLLDQGADVDAPAPLRTGGTALQLAAISGNCAIAGELLEAGADLHASPSRFEGRSPLEGAAEHGRTSMVELLWEFGNGCFDDTMCERAMGLAKENGHMACAGLIASLVAKRAQDPFGGMGGLSPLFG